MPSSSTSAATPVRHSILVVDDEDIILASLKTADRKCWVPSARWNAPIGSHVALHMSMRSAILLLTGLLLAGGPASGAGYLPLIGPAPLRFLREPAPSAWVSPAPATASSPLTVPDAPGPPDVEPVASSDAASNLSSNAVVTAVKSPELPGPETNGLGSLFVPFSTGIANEMITPQMLVEFFHQRFGDTNGPGTTVGVPLMFIPPRSGPRPASKAVLATP